MGNFLYRTFKCGNTIPFYVNDVISGDGGCIYIHTQTRTKNMKKIPYLVAEVSRGATFNITPWQFPTWEQETEIRNNKQEREDYDFVVYKQKHADKLDAVGLKYRWEFSCPTSPWIRYAAK